LFPTSAIAVVSSSTVTPNSSPSASGAFISDGSEVVNKARMDFGDQLTGRLDEGMSDSMFEFV
jgi:hypothetical protein